MQQVLAPVMQTSSKRQPTENQAISSGSIFDGNKPTTKLFRFLSDLMIFLICSKLTLHHDLIKKLFLNSLKEHFWNEFQFYLTFNIRNKIFFEFLSSATHQLLLWWNLKHIQYPASQNMGKIQLVILWLCTSMILNIIQKQATDTYTV